MPTNTKSKEEKAAIKRRQRARRKAGIAPTSGVPSTDLLGDIRKKKASAEVKNVAKLTERAAITPHKLKADMAARLLGYVVEGLKPTRAAQACGVPHITLKRWMNRADAALKDAEAEMMRLMEIAEAERTEADSKPEKSQKGGLKKAQPGEQDGEDGLEKAGNQAVSELSILELVPPSERVYVQFSLALSTAEARCELRLLRKISKGGRDWKANMTILERRFSESWAKEVKTTHTVEGDENKPIVVTYESDEERARRVANILRKADAIPGMGREIVDREDDSLAPLPVGDEREESTLDRD